MLPCLSQQRRGDRASSADATRTMVVKDPFKLHKHAVAVLEFYQREDDGTATLVAACRLLVCLASRDSTRPTKPP